jgi:hypothetical protein
MLSIHVNTSVQSLHPLEKTLNERLTRDDPQNDLNVGQKLGYILGTIFHQTSFHIAEKKKFEGAKSDESGG